MKKMKIVPVVNVQGNPGFTVLKRVFFLFWIRATDWDYDGRKEAEKIMAHLSETKDPSHD